MQIELDVELYLVRHTDKDRSRIPRIGSRIQSIRGRYDLLGGKVKEGKEYGPLIPPAATAFLNSCSIGDCSRAVVAYHEGQVIGWFRYDVDSRDKLRHLHARGTWVRPDFRRANIAKELWDFALSEAKPKAVHVTTISKAGRRLVEALQSSKVGKRMNWFIME